MNILYVEHYAGSDRYGMEFRPFYMAREWVKLGHDVTILAADFSHLRRENPKIQKDFTEVYDSGVRFVFVRTCSYRKNGIKRVFNMLGFMNKLKKNAKWLAETYRPDVVINSSTYPMDVYPAKKIADLCSARLFYEIHDIWPLSLMAMSKLTEKNPLIRYVQRAEDYCYKNCDGVVSILPDASRHIKERGFPNVNFHYVPNGIVLDAEAREPLGPQHKQVLDRLHAEGKFVVLYAGGHARSNALDCLVMSGKTLPGDVAVVLVGKGTEKQRLERLADENEISNVVFLDAVPKNQMQPLLEEADCLYIGAKKSELYQYGVGMNKIFDYMLAAKPIINGVESPGNPIDLAECGISVPAESASAIADAVTKLKGLPEQTLCEMGNKGREYVIANHQYDTLAGKFLEVIQ